MILQAFYPMEVQHSGKLHFHWVNGLQNQGLLYREGKG